MENKYKTLDWVVFILVVVGAVNWGLVGLFSFDLVGAIFGEMSALAKIVYVLVGIAGVYLIFNCKKMCK